MWCVPVNPETVTPEREPLGVQEEEEGYQLPLPLEVSATNTDTNIAINLPGC